MSDVPDVPGVRRPSRVGDPTRTSAEIRSDIEAQREDLGRSVEALRERVTEITDWRRHVREHKREIVIAAAATGFLVGGIVALRRRR